MIQNAANKLTQRLMDGETRIKGFPANLIERAQNKLAMIDAATELNDLASPPGNGLHALKDDRKGQHAIKINSQWRICFRWEAGDAYDVEITDYH